MILEMPKQEGLVLRSVESTLTGVSAALSERGIKPPTQEVTYSAPPPNRFDYAELN
jgi:hypothetical protein